MKADFKTLALLPGARAAEERATRAYRAAIYRLHHGRADADWVELMREDLEPRKAYREAVERAAREYLETLPTIPRDVLYYRYVHLDVSPYVLKWVDVARKLGRKSKYCMKLHQKYREAAEAQQEADT